MHPISNEVIKGFIDCEYKAYLLLKGEINEPCEFMLLENQYYNDCKMKFLKYLKYNLNYEKSTKLIDVHKYINTTQQIISIEKFYIFNDYNIKIDVLLNPNSLPINIQRKLKNNTDYCLINFAINRKITEKERLYITCLSQIIEEIIGKTCHPYTFSGEDGKLIKIEHISYSLKAVKTIEKICEIKKKKYVPDFFLSKACTTCRFQHTCREKAMRIDHLSLISGLKAREIEKLNSKGIFTINQYSYTFKPRRRPKRAVHFYDKRYYSLQALSVRERKIHVYNLP